MAWVKIDDQAPRNHKLLKAGPAACWLWVCGIAHCQSQLTDGFISDLVLDQIGIKGVTRVKRLAHTLAEVGLFDRVDDGYCVHDYHAFNATREEALAARLELSAKRSAAGSRGGAAAAKSKQLARRVAVANPSPIPSHPIRYEEPPNPLSGGTFTKRELRRATEIRNKRFGRCHHDPACDNSTRCIEAIAMELRRTA